MLATYTQERPNSRSPRRGPQQQKGQHFSMADQELTPLLPSPAKCISPGMEALTAASTPPNPLTEGSSRTEKKWG